MVNILRVIIFVSVSWLVHPYIEVPSGLETKFELTPIRDNEDFDVLANPNQAASKSAVVVQWADLEKFKIDNPNFSFSKIPLSGKIRTREKEDCDNLPGCDDIYTYSYNIESMAGGQIKVYLTYYSGDGFSYYQYWVENEVIRPIRREYTHGFSSLASWFPSIFIGIFVSLISTPLIKRILAGQGHSGEQFNRGLKYHQAKGARQDHAEAMKWYRLAAVQGNADAQNNIGLMYDQGQGVPEDSAEAQKWFRLAAKNGSSTAQNTLGQMHNNGRNVPKDVVKAYIWYTAAAARGNTTARFNLTNIKKHMSPEQIAEGYKRYRALIRRSQNSS